MSHGFKGLFNWLSLAVTRPSYSYKYQGKHAVQTTKKHTEKTEGNRTKHRKKTEDLEIRCQRSSAFSEVIQAKAAIQQTPPRPEIPDRRYSQLESAKSKVPTTGKSGYIVKLCICITHPCLLFHSIYHPRQNQRAWV